MDAVPKMFFDMHFRIAFLEKKNIEFEDWFAKLASHAHGSDFEEVRAYGN